MDMSVEHEKVYSYANQASVTVGPTDSVINYRWVMPIYDDKGDLVGEKIVKEVAITCSTKLVIENANNVLELQAKLEDLHEKNIQQPGDDVVVTE